MTKAKKLERPPCPLPKGFAHHSPDGSIDREALTSAALRFRFLRQQHPMTAGDILAAANHLAAHFEELRLTVPPTVQALRTSKGTAR